MAEQLRWFWNPGSNREADATGRQRRRNTPGGRPRRYAGRPVQPPPIKLSGLLPGAQLGRTVFEWLLRAPSRPQVGVTRCSGVRATEALGLIQPAQQAAALGRLNVFRRTDGGVVAGRDRARGCSRWTVVHKNPLRLRRAELQQ